MRRTPIVLSSSALALVLVASPAFAQAPPPPLPPAEPMGTPNQPPPQQSQQPPPGYAQQPPPGYGQPNYYPPPPQPYYYPPPPQQQRPAPPPPDFEPEPPTHAPKFSLWVGPRLSYMGFGFSFYRNANGTSETTGQLVGNGVAPEIDVGVRFAHRYIAFLFYEHGFLGAGHRFDGESNASASTDFYGVGFKFLSGDVDSVAFASDISIGKRVITVKNGT